MRALFTFLLLFSVLSLCYLFVFVIRIHAFSSISVSPPYFEVRGSGESPQSFEINYINNTEFPVNLRFSVGGYDPLASKFFNLESDDEPMTVEILLDSLESGVISPKGGFTLKGSIKDLKDTPSGTSYLAILAAQAPISDDFPEGPRFDSIIASIVSFTKIDGARTSFKIEEFSYLSSGFFKSVFPDSEFVSIRNTGNSQILPRGTIYIHDIFGRLISNGYLNFTSSVIVPNQSKLIPVKFLYIDNTQLFGINKLTLRVSDEYTHVGRSYSTWYFFMDRYFSLLLLGIVVSFLVYKSKTKWKKRIT